MRECSRVFDGWLTRCKKNCLLREYEIRSRLSRKVVIEALPPIDKGLLRMNGVFVEYVDRYFYLRGWAAMGGVPIACVFLGFSLFFGFDFFGLFKIVFLRFSICLFRSFIFHLFSNDGENIDRIK